MITLMKKENADGQTVNTARQPKERDKNYKVNDLKNQCLLSMKTRLQVTTFNQEDRNWVPTVNSKQQLLMHNKHLPLHPAQAPLAPSRAVAEVREDRIANNAIEEHGEKLEPGQRARTIGQSSTLAESPDS